MVGCPSAILTEDGFHKLLGNASKAVTQVDVDGYGANHGSLREIRGAVPLRDYLLEVGLALFQSLLGVRDANFFGGGHGICAKLKFYS